MKRFQAEIESLRAQILETSGRPVEILTRQDENTLVCQAPYDDADKAHTLFTQDKEVAGASLLYDLLRLRDHTESKRIFDVPEGTPSYLAYIIYGLYGLVTGKRVLNQLVQMGLSADDWAPLVEPYHNYKNLFSKKNVIAQELKDHWDLIVAHAFADASTALEVAKIPSARQALKAMKNNHGIADGKVLGAEIVALLDADFQDSRTWVEETFLAVMSTLKLDGMLEIREAATGKPLQIPNFGQKVDTDNPQTGLI